MKLLLIEDDASMQAALQRALSRRGMEVVGCTDGRQALGQWSAAQPDVVVLDLSLPGLDGLQVLEQARRQGHTTPVLILTARGTVGDRVGRLRSGSPTESRCGGSSRDGRSRAGSRRGSSAGADFGIGASSTRGGMDTPRGDPTAAVLGARTT